MSTGLAGVVLRDLVEGTVILFGLVLQSLMEEEVGPAQHLANSGRADLSVDVANHVRYLESRYHDVVVGEDEVTCDFPVTSRIQLRILWLMRSNWILQRCRWFLYWIRSCWF